MGSGTAVNRVWLECNRSISENCTQRDGYLDYFNQYERGKEIRIYQLGKLMIGRLMATHHYNDRALDRRSRRGIPYEVASGFAEEATVVLNWCLTGFAAVTGKITLGGMTQYTQSITNLIQNFRGVWECLVTLWFNADYLERYFELLDTPSQMNKGCLPVEKRADGEYKIIFDHVSFRYPGSDTYALKDINLEFRIGEKMAVVGMNGSGKSTFIKLLCRLYDPTEGTITMNGIDIRRYDYQEYMSLFSVVFQNFQLFSFTLGENVAVSEDYQEEAVRDALGKAGMEEFLENHGNSLSTVLYRDFDKDGVEVSGGEAQKIALARAVCKGAPFVLLDEPTAALDPRAEYEIYKRFNDLVADRTTVYISHRMSSCRFCGDIAVFHEGQVVQRGSHESLMQETNGKYYELWTAQAQYYSEEASETIAG
ncbi:MAG: ABC transporter ATP-binding protein [Lachnospiraceae bacterium]|nr:ABC transporter ATP-binding protein [Lachnospiraceae bacterium]